MNKDNPLLIGWREWASLPELKVPLIKVKIDTGAKTSALHAYDISVIQESDKSYAEFIIHPLQNNDKVAVKARAEIVDMRTIKSSNGQKEDRFVVRSPIKIGDLVWEIDITLTNRDIMHYRMLLGREAMHRLLVDPDKSYCQGLVSSKKALEIYCGKK